MDRFDPRYPAACLGGDGGDAVPLREGVVGKALSQTKARDQGFKPEFVVEGPRL